MADARRNAYEHLMSRSLRVKRIMRTLKRMALKKKAKWTRASSWSVTADVDRVP